MIEAGYDCYGGTESTIDTCYDICGDGYNMLMNDETYCDDGGDSTSDYDGCLPDCSVLAGWECEGATHDGDDVDTCKEVCGDGYLYFASGTNECDDGDDNVFEYDGCYDCMVQDGWYCMDRVDYETADVCYEEC